MSPPYQKHFIMLKKINHPGIPNVEAKLFCHHSTVIKILSQFLRRMNYNTKYINKVLFIHQLMH